MKILIVKIGFLWKLSRNRSFYSQGDPHPLLRSDFLDFLYVIIRLSLNVFLESDFTQEKKSFSSNYQNPLFLLLLCHKMVGKQCSRGIKICKTSEKCTFETPHNELNCILGIKDSNFNTKMGQNFNIRLRSGLRGLISQGSILLNFM